jgi:hypothetical protein
LRCGSIAPRAFFISETVSLATSVVPEPRKRLRTGLLLVNFGQRHCALRRSTLKKATLALVLVAASALPAFAADAAFPAGTNPRPQIAAPTTLDAVLHAMLGFLGL